MLHNLMHLKSALANALLDMCVYAIILFCSGKLVFTLSRHTNSVHFLLVTGVVDRSLRNLGHMGELCFRYLGVSFQAGLDTYRGADKKKTEASSGETLHASGILLKFEITQCRNKHAPN